MTKKITTAQAARMLASYENGTSVKSLASHYGLTIQAVYLWLPYVGLRLPALRRVKELEHRTQIAEGRFNRQKHLLGVATDLIKSMQRSPRKRSLLATMIRAKHGLGRGLANRIVGLSPTAGESADTARLDRILIDAMRRHQRLNPGGFKSMINTLIRDQPGTRYRALALYSEHLVTKRRTPLRGSLPKPRVKHLVQQGKQDAMWSMDFMQDALPSGARYWLLNVIDDFSREALIVRVLKRRSAKAVVEHLTAMSHQGRRPSCIRTDNGGEFKSVTYRCWTDTHSIRREFIRPRTPVDNAYIERFNKTLRSQFLSRYTFRSLAEVQRALDDWSLRYNFIKPHAALNELSPMQFLELNRRASHTTT